MKTSLLALCLVAACGPETTSFRTTDRGDDTDRGGPGAAAYDVQVADAAANVHVWSNGGYLGSSGEPMTHVGFEIQNRGATSIGFDASGLVLIAYDKRARPLPPGIFVAVTPLGPSVMPIRGGETVDLDVYFRTSFRPRVVDHMQVQWVLRIGDARHQEVTSFTRSDDYPVIEPAPRLDPTAPGA